MRKKNRQSNMDKFIDGQIKVFLMQHPEYKDKPHEEIMQAMQEFSAQVEIARKKRLKEHLEFFSDAVIAIILTIIVLEIQIPGENESYTQVISSIAVFMISFFIVASFWKNHHRLFDTVEEISDRIMLVEFIFLAFLSLIPLFTKWMMHDPSGFAVANYGVVYMLISLTISVLQYFIFQEGEVEYDETKEMFSKIIRSHLFLTLVLNLVLIVFGFYHPMIGRWWYALLPILSFVLSSAKDPKKQVERTRKSLER